VYVYHTIRLNPMSPITNDSDIHNKPPNVAETTISAGSGDELPCTSNSGSTWDQLFECPYVRRQM